MEKLLNTNNYSIMNMIIHYVAIYRYMKMTYHYHNMEDYHDMTIILHITSVHVCACVTLCMYVCVCDVDYTTICLHFKNYVG